MQSRIDASDVIQEAHVEVVTRLNEYLSEPKYPFFWLRLIVGERLLKLHRHHLGTQMRDAAPEVSLYRGALPAASSAALAAQLLGKHTSPTQAAVRAERMMRLQEALNALDPMIQTGPDTWTLTITGVPVAAFQYKFTLGGWSSVEETASCGDVANRTFGFDTADASYTANDTVAAWEGVGGC